MAGTEYSERELLIAMRGDIALIRKDFETTQVVLTEHRAKHHDLANTVQILVADKHKRDGEVVGFGKAVRAIYALSTICGLGGIAAAAKVLIGGS
jgi:hypothetical protein